MNEADRQMALLLQKQFDMEISIEKPTNNLAYYDKKKKKEYSPNKSKSLIDPSWELVDPTPNIHVLFMAFNERFFWNKLLAVSVSWSKRMTTCAGVCSYHGRSGECKITVSEPLLKLRPRKDLIETLLHEMIHALLFVTRNNRDRDGHGPEFHKHMYRINNEAGTNITVYHDFHDEVRLYQQHWWRCDGPCQTRRPFFGMVRRAMNRAPGPNDRWWGDHQRSCGGKFIKVKEPEKVTKAKEKKEPKVKEIKNNNAGDIRKFIGVTGKTGDKNKSNKTNNIKKPINNELPSNINTISSIKGAGAFGTKNKNGTVVLNPTPKVAKPNTNKENVPVRPKNNIVTIKDLDSETNNNVIPVKPHSSSVVSPITDYSVVRNKWLDKFDNKNKKSGDVKRKSSGDSNASEPKKAKIDDFAKPGNKSEKSVNGFWKSPVKDLVTPEKKVNGFWKSPTSVKTDNNSSSEKKVNGFWKSPVKIKVETDLSPVKNVSPVKIKTENEAGKKVNGFWKSPVKIKTENTEELDKVNCPVCDKLVLTSKLNKHLDQCLQNDANITSELKDEMSTDLKLVQCPSCNKFIEEKDLNDHLDLCLTEPKPSTSQPKPITSNLAQCEICDNFVNSEEISTHTADCLNKYYDEIEKKYSLNGEKIETTACLVCSKDILKVDLDAHLDTCMGSAFDGKMDDENVEEEEEEEEEDSEDVEEGENLDGTKNSLNSSKNSSKIFVKEYNCPMCLKLIAEEEMNTHIDECLTQRNFESIDFD